MKKENESSMQKLTKEEMKKIMGGLRDNDPGCTSCSSNSDCGSGEACSSLSGFPNCCYSVSTGSSCSGDGDCGNGQHCVNKPIGSGKWCN